MSPRKLNAVKHGAYAQLLFPWEDQQEFLSLKEELRTRYPVRKTQGELLLGRLTMEHWRLRRLAIAELIPLHSAVFPAELCGAAKEGIAGLGRYIADPAHGPSAIPVEDVLAAAKGQKTVVFGDGSADLVRSAYDLHNMDKFGKLESEIYTRIYRLNTLLEMEVEAERMTEEAAPKALLAAT
jgi:hypothetical protein